MPSSYLHLLPSISNNTLAKWVYISSAAFANLPGTFNRPAMEAPWATESISDDGLAQTLTHLSTTDFIAYDPKFFDLIGPNATIEHVQKLVYRSHEAPCYIKNQLFFVEWGLPGGDDGCPDSSSLLSLQYDFPS